MIFLVVPPNHTFTQPPKRFEKMKWKIFNHGQKHFGQKILKPLLPLVTWPLWWISSGICPLNKIISGSCHGKTTQSWIWVVCCSDLSTHFVVMYLKNKSYKRIFTRSMHCIHLQSFNLHCNQNGTHWWWTISLQEFLTSTHDCCHVPIQKRAQFSPTNDITNNCSRCND